MSTDSFGNATKPTIEQIKVPLRSEDTHKSAWSNLAELIVEMSE